MIKASHKTKHRVWAQLRFILRCWLFPDHLLYYLILFTTAVTTSGCMLYAYSFVRFITCTFSFGYKFKVPVLFPAPRVFLVQGWLSVQLWMNEWIPAIICPMNIYAPYLHGLPWWLSGKEPACQRRRHKSSRFDPWVGKIPWRRAWRPTPVFLPEESYG